MNPHVDPRLVKSYMDARINAMLEPLGINASCALLLKVIDSDPGRTLTQYSTVLMLNKSRVTRMVRQLSDRGLVENASESARDHKLVLTEKGHEAIGNVDFAFSASHISLFEGVTPEEMEVFDRILEKINANIQSDHAMKGGRQ